ncbi:hypothetical protein D3C85_1526230 [compost metagenome]
MVGNWGLAGERWADVTAIGTILPVSIIGLTDGAVPKVSCTSPAATACADGAPPLYGTWVIFTPASLVK